MEKTIGESSVSFKTRERVYKRPLDLAVLVLTHMLLLPLWGLLWIVIALAIWLEDGGAIF